MRGDDPPSWTRDQASTALPGRSRPCRENGPFRDRFDHYWSRSEALGISPSSHSQGPNPEGPGGVGYRTLNHADRFPVTVR